jgi:hypothetical protein
MTICNDVKENVPGAQNDAIIIEYAASQGSLNASYFDTEYVLFHKAANTLSQCKEDILSTINTVFVSC